jgi:putative DNA primase/helicase
MDDVLLRTLRDWIRSLGQSHEGAIPVDEWFRLDSDEAMSCKVNPLDSGGAMAYVKDWRSGESWNWFSDDGTTHSDLTDEEKKIRRELRENRIREAAEIAARAATKALEEWMEAEPVEGRGHPYLQAKNVESYGLRKDSQGRLLIPVMNGGGLQSIQQIYPGGKKIFRRDCKAAGGAFLIGTPQPRTRIWIVEGYATGATVHAALDEPVLVAFNAGNLDKVARQARKEFPRNQIIIAGDNDQWTTGNPGWSKAEAIAVELKCKFLVPDFKGLDLDGKPTDFNDLAKLAGTSKVRFQLLSGIGEDPFELDTITLADLRIKEIPPLQWIVKDLLPRGVYTVQGGKADGKSLFAQHLSWAVATGTPAFRYAKWEPDPGKVLYLFYEGGERRARSRFDTLPEVNGEKNLEITYKRIHLSTANLIELDRWLRKTGPWKMIVIDMITQAMPIDFYRSKSSDGDYQKVSEFCDAIRTLGQDHGCTFLLLRHTRKGGAENHTEAGLGSVAWATAVDGSITLNHDRDKQVITVQMTGNDLPHDQTFRLDSSKGVDLDFLGFGKELTESEQSVFDVLAGSPGESFTAMDLDADLKMSVNTIKTCLGRMAKAQTITKIAKGKYAYIP